MYTPKTEQSQSGNGKTSHSRKKHRRSGRSHKPNPYKNLENFISKYLLRIVGFILILAFAGYSLNSLHLLKGIVKQAASAEKTIEPQSQGNNLAGSSVIPVKPPEDMSEDILMMGLLCLGLLLLFTALILFSVKIGRKEIPRISVALFYPLLFLLARKYGWQVHFIFPVLIAFSALVFYSGTKLHSTLAGKWNYLVCWLFFLAWWIMKMIIPGNASLLWVFMLYATVIYLMFLIAGASGGFTGRHKYSDYTEKGLIVLNISVFYLSGMLSLARTGNLNFAWIFSLLIPALILGLLSVLANMDKRPDPAPYVIPAMFILSLILPVIFTNSALVLFFATFSSLLLFYSRYSGNRLAVITALISLVIMLLAYFKDWAFQYLPVAFLGNVLDNRALMIKGLVAGLVIFPVIIINGRLIRKLHVDFSKEWFSKRTYQRFFKGVNLIVLYLSGYWIVNYFILILSRDPNVNFMSWFLYNSAFFIILIPMLSVQKSKYIAPAIGFAMFFSLAYPSLIHFTNVNLRNDLLNHEHLTRFSFWFHYPVVLFFIAEIIVLAIFLRKVFEKNAFLVRSFSAYLLGMILFIILSEYDHYTIWTGLKRGITIEEIVLANRTLPYTLILLAFSFTVLFIGMFRRNSFLRTAGLVLLMGTLAKMLYLDVRSFSGTARTLVLFTVGAIVLVLSFMYPKLKRYFREMDHQAHGIRRHHRSSGRRKHTSIPGVVQETSKTEPRQD